MVMMMSSRSRGRMSLKMEETQNRIFVSFQEQPVNSNLQHNYVATNNTSLEEQSLQCTRN